MTKEPSIHFALANRDHLCAIVSLLVDDELGSGPERTGGELDERYIAAFDSIEADPNNELIVTECDGSIVGTLQITYAANLTHMGAIRATIEGVRVSSRLRSSGIGTQMLNWPIDRCRS